MPYKIAVVGCSGQLCETLAEAGHEVVALSADENFVQNLIGSGANVVLNQVPGDAVVRLCDMLGIATIGCEVGVCTAASQRALMGAALASFYAGDEGAAYAIAGASVTSAMVEQLGLEKVPSALMERVPGGYPACVKPARAGKGPQAVCVNNDAELIAALKTVLAACDEALVQEWVEGVRICVPVLSQGWDAYALPAVELCGGEMHVPVRLEQLNADASYAQAIRSEIERAAIETYQAYGCRDIAAVHLIWDGGRCRILGVDTAPSLEPDSPSMAGCEVLGLSAAALLNELLDQALYR